MAARALMVQGTASSVGKSLLVAALCRIFRQDGYRVAPFKAQNLSLNAAVTREGHEIGRAQAVQAEAAGLEPTVDMNPILLKPEAGGRCQVVLLGRPVGSLSARDYSGRAPELWATAVAALERLRATCDVLIVEGAGSPAEPNLRASDLANMRVARHLGAPVLLVGDLERGGVFAALVGTLELLEPEERDLVRGLVVNRQRGDRRLLEAGLAFLERRTGKPVLGVIPYLPGLRLADEDAAALDERAGGEGAGPLDVAVIRLPHLANFDDFDLLGAEPAVRLRYVDRAAALGAPDLVVLPGTKSTAADLGFLRRSGLAERIVERVRLGTPVLGICGGYQMLGRRLLDPLGVESWERETPGLGLLPAETVFAAEKRTVRVRARAAGGDGWIGSLAGLQLEAYEIHAGRTVAAGPPLFYVAGAGEEERPDGCQSADGLVYGTYLHGLFEHPAARQALLRWLGARRGLALEAYQSPGGGAPSREGEYDRLAAAVRASLDLAAVRRLLDLP